MTTIPNLSDLQNRPTLGPNLGGVLKHIQLISFQDSVDHTWVRLPMLEVKPNSDQYWIALGLEGSPEPQTFLCDSGSSVNAISNNIFMNLPLVFQNKLQQSDTPTLGVAKDDQTVAVSGQILLNLQIDLITIPTIFYVCPKLTHDLLLGNNFLKDHTAIITYNSEIPLVYLNVAQQKQVNSLDLPSTSTKVPFPFSLFPGKDLTNSPRPFTNSLSCLQNFYSHTQQPTLPSLTKHPTSQKDNFALI
jgi:hypothetical protein